MRTWLLSLIALGSISLGIAQAPERGAPLPRKGVFGAALAPVAAQGGQPGGLRITAISPGLTAERLGLKVGDIVTEIAGEPTPAAPALSGALRKKNAGDSITVRFIREGQASQGQAALVARPLQRPDGFRVHYDQVVSQGKRIRIIATHPEGSGPHPTIFLIGGIGAYSSDGDFATAPYGNILGPLAKSGYATVRIDKPGQGDSEGPTYTELTYTVERDAYLQALRLAKTLPFVDKNRIAIFGHSMGGSFGPQVAAQESVRGLIVHGTLARTWYEYTLENSRRQMELGGTPPAVVSEQMIPLARVMHYLFNEGKSPAEIKTAHPDLAEAVNGMIPDGRTYSGVGLPFFQELAKENLAAAWQNLGETQVLALYGENDFISGITDHQDIARWVNARRPGTATFTLVPQSDHGFNQTSSPRDSMEKWGRPGATFNSNIIDILKSWLEKTLK